MLQLISLLQKRPKDKTIMIWRVIFWLLYITILSYNFLIQENNNTIESTIFWMEISESVKNYIIYFIISLWVVPLIMWATNYCLTRKKYIRILQILFWITLFIASSIVVEWPNLDIDTLLVLIAFLPLIAGITGKCITSKCLKYWETIKKIRV